MPSATDDDLGTGTIRADRRTGHGGHIPTDRARHRTFRYILAHWHMDPE